MTNTAKRLSASLLLAVTSSILLGGTAYAMDINDDADLDTSVVEDHRGCHYESGKEICSYEDWQEALRKQDEYAKNHPEVHGLPAKKHH